MLLVLKHGQDPRRVPWPRDKKGSWSPSFTDDLDGVHVTMVDIHKHLADLGVLTQKVEERFEELKLSGRGALSSRSDVL